MNVKNEKGFAFLIALFSLTLLIGFSSAVVLRTVYESRIARIDLETEKSFHFADAGTQAGLVALDELINTHLRTTINNANPQTVINYTESKALSGDSVEWLAYAVRDDDGDTMLTNDGTEAHYYVTNDDFDGGGYYIDIRIAEKEEPQVVMSGEMWEFAYNYTVEVDGFAGDEDFWKKVLLIGDFKVSIQRDNFAKYALFTGDQRTQSGSYVWFTDNTNFSGPMHTNGRYNFSGVPAGVFYDVIQQGDQYARFYNGGSSVSLDADSNGETDVPYFYSGFTRNVEDITINSSSEKEDMIDRVTNGENYWWNGVYVPNNGTDLTGGIYVKGNTSLELQVDANNNAVYKIGSWRNTTYVTVDLENEQTTVVSGGSATTYNGIPDGTDDIGTLIYVDGTINSFEGTVQADTQLTIASTNDIVINGNVLYSDYSEASGTIGEEGYVAPNAEEKTNLLGIVSWNGDVRIGTSAPDNVNIHGTVLALNGVFQVDNHDDQWKGPRGTATVLGGVITDKYGAFGTFNGNTGQDLSGYGRNFVYDQRMQQGDTPPYFPSLQAFIAFSNDIEDKLVWQEGGF